MNKKENKFFLWWLDLVGKKRYPAGMAFRDENFGDYRLIVDCFPNRKLFLKDRKTQGKKIIFDLWEHICLEKGIKKYIIGYAFSSDKTKGNIHILIAPIFAGRLLLTF